MKYLSFKKQLSLFLIIWALVFGLLVRALPILLKGFPINDGGLFYTMIQDLLRAKFALPEYTTYNDAGIPFTYPPLSFYVMAFLTKWFQTDPLVFIKWVPVTVSTFSIVVFYFLAQEFTEDDLLASISTLSFAMLPTSATWITMGGGVTRSFGILFSLLTILFGYRLFQRGTWREVLLTALSASLLVLSHPEWSIQTVGVILLFFLVQKNKLRNIRLSFAVAILVLMITLPWWLKILVRGFAMDFVNPLATGFHNWANLLPPLMLTFGQERYFPIITMVGVLGGIYIFLTQRRWWIFWFFIPFIMDPRTGFSATAIPLSISAGFGVMLLVKLFSMFGDTNPRVFTWQTTDADITSLWQKRTSRWLLGFYIIYTLTGALGNAYLVSNVVLNSEVLSSFNWIKTSLPQKSSFLLITGEPLFTNPIQEWFFPLTGSNSITTYQGKEWTPYLYDDIEKNFDLQACRYRLSDCLDAWLEEYPSRFDYIYIYEGEVPTLGLEVLPESRSLGYSLMREGTFRLIYNTKNIKIFAR